MIAVDHRTEASAAEYRRLNGGIQEAPIDAHDVYNVPSQDGEQTFWVSYPGDLLEVRASSRALLERALSRTGSREALLAVLPDTTIIDTNASDVVVCRPRPQPTTQWAGPSPTAPTVAQVCKGHSRFEIWSTTAQPHLGIDAANATRELGYYGHSIKEPEGTYRLYDLRLLYGRLHHR